MSETAEIGRDGVEADVPDLVVVCGLPGAGKTTIAAAVADRIDGERLRTDVVRKDLFPDPDYTDEETRAIYRELLGRARERLAEGDRVVLDGTFQDAAFREWVVDLARDLGVAYEVLKVECEESVVEERIAAREGDESDADFEIHRMFRRTYDPLEVDHETVDNSGTEAETLRSVAELF